MGRRGPQPTPTKVLELRGSHRAKERAARGEPVPSGSAAGVPRCPDRIARNKDAHRCWKYHVRKLRDTGLLSMLDVNVFARYCHTWASYVAAADFVDKHGPNMVVKNGDTPIGYVERPEVSRMIRWASVLDKLERKLGLSPADRSGFVALDKPQRDSAEQSLERRLFGGPA